MNMLKNKILIIGVFSLLITSVVIVSSQTIIKEDSISIEFLGKTRLGQYIQGDLEVKENYISENKVEKLGFTEIKAYSIEDKEKGDGSPIIFNVNLYPVPDTEPDYPNPEYPEKGLASSANPQPSYCISYCYTMCEMTPCIE